MKRMNWKQIVALMSAVLLLVGCCLPVAADEPPYNDGILDWGDEPPVIVTQPADASAYNGEEATVTVEAEGILFLRDGETPFAHFRFHLICG